jgi:hypothetical protein
MGSPAVIGTGTAMGSALLAFWIVLRYRAFGPQTIRTALAACLVSGVLLEGIGPAMKWTLRATDPAVALLAVAVPLFVCAFWSAGVLMRALLDAGGGRPARQRVPRDR